MQIVAPIPKQKKLRSKKKLSHGTCQVSYVTCLFSGVRCQMSCVACQCCMWPMICPLSTCHKCQQPQPQTLPLLTPPIWTVRWNAMNQKFKKIIILTITEIYWGKLIFAIHSSSQSFQSTRFAIHSSSPTLQSTRKQSFQSGRHKFYAYLTKTKLYSWTNYSANWVRYYCLKTL